MLNRLLAHLILFFAPGMSKIVDEARRVLLGNLTVFDFARPAARFADSDLMWIIDNHTESAVRCLAVRSLHGKGLPVFVLRTHWDEETRLAALGGITDQRLLVECANSDRSEKVRVSAARLVTAIPHIGELERSPFLEVRLVARELKAKGGKSRAKKPAVNKNLN